MLIFDKSEVELFPVQVLLPSVWRVRNYGINIIPRLSGDSRITHGRDLYLETTSKRDHMREIEKNEDGRRLKDKGA